MTRDRLSLPALALACVVSCAPEPALPATAGHTTEGSTSTEAPLSTSSSTTGEDTEVDTTDDDETTTGDCNFVCDDSSDDGPVVECDLYAQDCVEGEKCTAIDTDGDGAVDGTVCVTVVDAPAGLEEPCMRLGTNGEDTCDVGQICWDPDPNGVGMCMAFCSSSPEQPICPEGMECVGKDGFLCMPLCEPIEQACPVGCGCYPADEGFFCLPDTSGDEGVKGDACEFINACDPGLLCLNSDVVVNCEGSVGCCTEYCDVEQPACDEDCVPWYEMGMAPPGYETLGVCLKAEAP